MKLFTLVAVALIAANAFAAAEQCKGTTKKGEPCKKTTTHESGYCHMHRAQAGQ
jgi:hypothetical protein